MSGIIPSGPVGLIGAGDGVVPGLVAIFPSRLVLLPAPVVRVCRFLAESRLVCFVTLGRSLRFAAQLRAVESLAESRAHKFPVESRAEEV